MITRQLLLLSCLLTAAACLGDDASPPDQRPMIDMPTLEPDQGDAPDMADMEQPGPPASLAVDPTSLDLEIGASTRITLTILDAAGREVAAQDEVGWSSDDERVAVVDAPGDVLALGPGSTTLRARLGACAPRSSAPSSSFPRWCASRQGCASSCCPRSPTRRAASSRQPSIRSRGPQTRLPWPRWTLRAR
jgi:hypothetical protein